VPHERHHQESPPFKARRKSILGPEGPVRPGRGRYPCAGGGHAAGRRATFQANLKELTGLDYAGVIATAKQNGYQTGSLNLGTSIQFLVFPLLPLLGAV